MTWAAILAACALVLAIYTFYLPFGVDYLLYFRPPVDAWLRGTAELFDPVKTKGFFDMPWMAFLLVPFLWLRPPVDLALWRALNLAGVITAARVFRGGAARRWGVLAVVQLYVLHALLVANVDGVILLGVALAWLGVQRRGPRLVSLGLWLISFKPFNALLFGVVVLAALWRWAWREKLVALALPALSLVTSFFIFGLDWPARYLNNLKVVPPWPIIITTTWRAAEALGLPRWPVGLLGLAGVGVFLWALFRSGPTLEVAALGLATNFCVTTYALEPHYILLIPAFLVVGARRPELAALAYLLTLILYALRAPFGLQFVWLAAFYPLILLAGSWYAVVNGWQRMRSG